LRQEGKANAVGLLQSSSTWQSRSPTPFAFLFFNNLE